MGKMIVLGSMAHSKIIIQNNSIAVRRNTKVLGDETTGIIYIMTDVAIELGRPLSQLIVALQNTRIPLTIQRVVNKGLFESYKVVRINTGIIPNVNIGFIEVYSGSIVGFIFDNDMLENKHLLKYVKLSALNRIAIKNTDIAYDKIESALRIVLKTTDSIEKHIKKRAVVYTIKSNAYKVGIEYKCILGNDGRYTVSSVSIPSSYYMK